MNTLTLSLALFTAAVAGAQTTPGVIGVTSTAPLVVEQDPGTCATSTCSPTGLSPRLLPYEGGTAYDASAGGVWVATSGPEIAQYDPDTCATLCPPTVPAGAAWGHVTGLATDERSGTLYLSDEMNRIYTLDAACPPAVTGGCLAAVPVGHLIGGLAVDDVRRRLFYSTSDFTTFPGMPPLNTIWVSTLGDYCSPFCSFSIPSCGPTSLGQITGLGFDACTSHLWVTDGTTTIGLLLPATGMPCSPTLTHCCSLGLGAEEFGGLCFKPSRATVFGTPCATGTCATCPTPMHLTFGDPTLGNPDFAVYVDGAPSGSAAYMMLNFGDCTSGLPVPVFCGALHVPLSSPPITVGPFPVSGFPGGCGAEGVLLPIPLDLGMCGLPVCSQWLGLCGTSSWMSNALGWTVSSS